MPGLDSNYYLDKHGADTLASEILAKLAVKVNTSDLADVAVSGSYDDLFNKPSIPAAQVQSDWNVTSTTSKAYIKNKPSLASVATSGSYNDLSNKPTIPTVGNATLTIQKNSASVGTFRANATTDATINITVPTKTSELTNNSGFITSSGLATVATSGSYTDLSNKPTIPTISDTYSSTSSNGMSGKAVAAALATLPTPMVFKGSLGTGGTITSLPTASSSNAGFVYKVITAGTYASQSAKVGDVFISNGSSWVLIPSGDDSGGSGTVTSVGLTIGSGEGLVVDSSSTPITTSGTLKLSIDPSHKLVTTSEVSSWNTAASNATYANGTYSYGECVFGGAVWSSGKKIAFLIPLSKFVPSGKTITVTFSGTAYVYGSNASGSFTSTKVSSKTAVVVPGGVYATFTLSSAVISGANEYAAGIWFNSLSVKIA